MANAVITFLEHVGKDILAVFKEGDVIAKDIEPIIAVALPGISSIYNMVVAAVGNAEALGSAAAATASTDAQKLANVLTAVGPTVTQTLTGFGIAVDKSHLVAYINAVVASLNALPAPTAPVTVPAPVAK